MPDSIEDRAGEFFDNASGDLGFTVDFLLDEGADAHDVQKLLVAFASAESERAVREYATALHAEIGAPPYGDAIRFVFESMFGKKLEEGE
jgi:hypothetical protein